MSTSRVAFLIGFVFVGLLSRSSWAAPKDAQAEQAIKDAMEKEYLNTRFDKAAVTLVDAIDACGADGCSKPVKARLFIALGTVLAGGKNQLEDAKDVFVEALKLDPTATPDADLIKAEISYAFDKARTELKLGNVSALRSKIAHTAAPEQRVRTPLPLFVEIPVDLAPSVEKVTVVYLAPGEQDWKTLVMKRLGERGYGIQIPCAELRQLGTLRYYVQVTGLGGELLHESGSRKAPLLTSIKEQIGGDPPHWPGFVAPEQCAAVEIEGPKECLDDGQCNEGMACSGGRCVARGAEGAKKKRRSNWIGLGFSPDLAILSSDDVCSPSAQDNDHFVCYREDGSRYGGTPAEGDGAANNINTGFALGTLRLTLSYERVVQDNITLGARAGFAFNGASGDDASFLPLHLEARASYYLTRRPFERLGARPFVFVSGGLAQVDAKTEVEVRESDATCGAVDPRGLCSERSPDGVRELRKQELTTYKQAGQGFVALGAGVAYAPIEPLSLQLALRANVMLPVVIAVISPELAVSLGF